jgi:hypothetical protein
VLGGSQLIEENVFSVVIAHYNTILAFSRDVLISLAVVDVLEMSTKVSTLGECLVAEAARERTLASVLSEVITKVAGLLEHRVAIWVHAFKVEFDALSLRVPHFNRLVPLSRDA